jgi:hypothetical protein
MLQHIDISRLASPLRAWLPYHFSKVLQQEIHVWGIIIPSNFSTLVIAGKPSRALEA